MRTLLRLVAGLTLALLRPGVAAAQTPGPISLQTLAPPAPGDALFTVPDAGPVGERGLAVGLTTSYALDPLVLERGGVPIPGAKLVRQQLWTFAQASVGLGERLRFDAALPLVLYQSGDQAYASVPAVQAQALGDLRLGGQAWLGALGPWDLTAGLDLWLPTGSRPAYASDGSASVQGKVVAGGHIGRLGFGAQVGLLIAETVDVAYGRTGSAVTYAGGATWRIGDFRVGPEVWGRVGLDDTRSPSELLLGGHWCHAPVDLGLAVATDLIRDPGASPLRVVLSMAWRDGAACPADQDEPAGRPEPAPALASATAAPPPEPEPLPPSPPAPPEVTPAEAVASASPPPALPQRPVQVVVQFAFDRSEVRPSEEPPLRRLAEAMAQAGEPARLVLTGHTDSSGPADYNRALSRRRAEAVRRWLLERGQVPASRIELRWSGPDAPTADNATPAGRIANRRVEAALLRE